MQARQPYLSQAPWKAQVVEVPYTDWSGTGMYKMLLSLCIEAAPAGAGSGRKVLEADMSAMNGNATHGLCGLPTYACPMRPA